MEVNEQAFDTAMALSSKSSVLATWDKKQEETGNDQNGNPEEPPQIRTLREEVTKLEEKSESLESKKSELEWNLAVARKKGDKLEEEIKKIGVDEQREMLDLLSRLHEAEVESTSLSIIHVLNCASV